MDKNHKKQVIKLDDFAVQNAKAKSNSPVQDLIRHLVRETNKHKLDYLQLKYIFRVVRERCNIEIPNQKRKLYELPTAQELKHFYEQVANPSHKLLFETLQGTGLRISELCNLELQYVDFDNNTIFVKNGKGGKDRVTVFGNTLKEKLRLYLQGKANRYLFESSRNTKFTPRRIQQLHEKYRAASGIEKKFTIHTFRHLWNSALAASGISRELREILAGHAKGSKTQDIYTHLSVAGQKEKILEVLK